MKPLLLHALLAVADTGSITAAARREGTSRATIRTRIDDLAGAVGVPLLEMSAFGTKLTPAALRMTEPAQALLKRLDGLRRLVGPSTELLGHYRVAAPLGLAPPVTSLLRRLAQRTFPDSSFEILLDADPVSLLGTEADWAVHFGPTVPDGPWITSRLVRMHERLVATPEYLERHGTPATLDDLARHRLIVWERPGLSGRRLPLAGGGDWAVEPWLVTNDSWFVWNAAEAGEAICLLPFGPLPAGETRPELVHVLPGVVHRDCTLQGVFHSGLLTVPRARTIGGLFRALISEL